MRIGEIIGHVTLSTYHPKLRAGRWKLAVPMKLSALQGDPAGRSEAIVIYDELGAGLGSLVAIAEGPEATAPFHPEQKPIDGYNAAILDHLDIEDV
ncbi:EutN/CcmL family microcompartment protein [Rubinisphaera brasiliensis]|uniref:Ethanolamine utilization protein EutN/carboxysome structural protein Ccml n=1 Tax=Rubinisphaera brasiliensis (strain ATCC 49424 / DSM 5305 / JCM 21570 / IAM 15109 / NBRC 103401 / IFAM 1448) TaxID=756272 RepID=F0SHA4_RUBBR|nr:EutN/CcmL family microcompartment protein [Rubinisphaera brasiliensis]ADY61659.1 Ethanolamine utilization protein EutN/carboxysome structural protein Ccml [Rubinisphaera brasiliensis DSM 5305]